MRIFANNLYTTIMEIKIVNLSQNALPNYETQSSAGMDLRANIDQSIIIQPNHRSIVPTGLYIELPLGFEAQIRPRSGMAIKNGVTVLNSPGTIDADYRGEIKVILINLSDEPFTIHNGDRIAQMVISKHEKAHWITVSELNETKRGNGGFGHTGK